MRSGNRRCRHCARGARDVLDPQAYPARLPLPRLQGPGDVTCGVQHLPRHVEREGGCRRQTGIRPSRTASEQVVDRVEAAGMTLPDFLVAQTNVLGRTDVEADPRRDVIA